MYCETCEELICYKCTSNIGAHSSHKYKDLGKVCEGYIAEMNKGVAALEELFQEVSTQQAAIHAKIQENAEQVQRTKAQMISRLDGVAEKKLAAIRAQIQEVETTKELYQNPSDVLSKGVSLINRMKKTASIFRADNTKPDIGADMIFASPKGYPCKELGQVLLCYATGEGLKKLSVSQHSTVTLYCHTTDNASYTNKESLWCRLRFRYGHAGDISISEISTNRDRMRYGYGQFLLTLKPDVTGWHKLHIKVCDQHIMGSPFRVHAE